MTRLETYIVFQYISDTPWDMYCVSIHFWHALRHILYFNTFRHALRDVLCFNTFLTRFQTCTVFQYASDTPWDILCFNTFLARLETLLCSFLLINYFLKIVWFIPNVLSFLLLAWYIPCVWLKCNNYFHSHCFHLAFWKLWY